MQPQRIEQLDDPRVADFRHVRDATLARERGRFIVEGRGNLFVLLGLSAIQPEAILLSERAWRALGDRILEQTPACPLYVARQEVFDGVAGFPVHRGVLASARRPPPREPLILAESLLGGPRAPRILLLEGLMDHDNVGGVFRNAMGLGGDAVLLCPRTCDPLYRKAIRTSMGGTLCVPFARATGFDELLRGLEALGYALLALDPAPSGVDLARIDPATLGPVAILLGTEGAGLSEAALERADIRARIDMEPGVDSLNVSVAAAIALHCLRVESSSCPGAAPAEREGSSEHGG
jgi:tRNA G18 (ribose-2'-O)-methylase SpoU